MDLVIVLIAQNCCNRIYLKNSQNCNLSIIPKIFWLNTSIFFSASFNSLTSITMKPSNIFQDHSLLSFSRNVIWIMRVIYKLVRLLPCFYQEFWWLLLLKLNFVSNLWRLLSFDQELWRMINIVLTNRIMKTNNSWRQT